MTLNPIVEAVTQRIIERSALRRRRYLSLIDDYDATRPARVKISEANRAHGAAGCAVQDKIELLGGHWPSIGIVTAYNDMLSAHAPYEHYPEIIRKAAREVGAVAQVAGGVPAMCDGVTQGFEGMELSLFSRDVIALSTAVSLSHATFDAALLLGICDKIVPGLLIGALRFPWLPTILVPGGPMPSGLPNKEKAARRQLFAEGKIGREELLQAEAESYHAPGTCTFYGTANSNQMMMEVMGLHLPGAAFVNPNTPLRDALTIAATKRAAKITGLGDEYRPIGRVVDEKAIVNAIVGLMATGGSTNHFIHLPAIALAAGIEVTWDDFAELSHATPLLARIYPNGSADVNHFHAAGGMGFLTRELLDAGLLHGDIATVGGESLADYAKEPILAGETLSWREAPASSADDSVLRGARAPFSSDGGLRLLSGGLGRACVKVSAVADDKRIVEAPALVFSSQADVQAAFKRGDLDRDCVIVVRGQGPRANGMPELHKLMPLMGALQDRGFRVALATDGRMSGASGKVLAAIHITPEAAEGGSLAKVRDGDVVRVDAETGVLDVIAPTDWRDRAPVQLDLLGNTRGVGRELFAMFRANACSAERGGSAFPDYDPI
ncbi:phosphogluconate dehydratase [Candidatus Viadribacter manganicus]|uniref:Phosphogluconate dehydratase n=1 Tax=Candidatus Viadribacter manganicus TaxID=1759059 RepID=A0A1B1AHR7_9PROT|nr:phosphogluconate dehydratase [Candidatus Viadribacter manganicus]ANP46097.1 phosphogluconate dehydratase [Candidatus Viadribacter manganicus]